VGGEQSKAEKRVLFPVKPIINAKNRYKALKALKSVNSQT
jgi:hypothetical protein